MRIFTHNARKIILFAGTLAVAGVLAAMAYAAISQYPLFLTGSVQPNVMILLDNSGSMNTIMEHRGYNPKVAYTGSFKGDEYYKNKIDYSDKVDTYYLISNISGHVVTGNDKKQYTVNGRSITLPFPYVDTRWNGNYLNWIFFHATEAQYGTLATDASLKMTRIQTARGVISDVVKNVSGVRFGLFKLNDSQGGSKVKDCGMLTPATVDAAVNEIDAKTWTPLGEALSEIWQYFRGGNSLYNSGKYTSPIEYWCQKNYTIIVTDGEPTYDGCYKGPFEKYGCSNGENDQSHLADVSQYMYDKKVRGSGDNGPIVSTYAIGLTLDSTILSQAGEKGGGRYFTTTSGINLATALQEALVDILSKEAAGSSVAVNTSFLGENSRLYRAWFKSPDWIGYLEAFKLNATTGAIIGYPNSPDWEAGSLLNARSSPRAIYTAGMVGTTYKRLEYSTAHGATLAGAGFMNFSSAIIGYIRGDLHGNTTPAGYRKRASKLGDIISSSPVVYGPPDGSYTDNAYKQFKKDHKDRQELILVGANDGMLHAFDAASGDEAWAFIPNMLLNKLKLLRNDPYAHTSYVNGAITVADAYIQSKKVDGTTVGSTEWRSIAVCGLRDGGKGFFALDITDPANPIPLWELTATSSTPSNGLGYSFGTPLILKLRDKDAAGGFRWVTALANGYEGPTSRKAASLIIADLATGAVVSEIVVDNTAFSGSSSNGLASPAAIDKDMDGFADTLYAGDLNGNMWRFDVSSAKAADWKADCIFAAGASQPITTAPDVVVRLGYQYVFFGTGKYLDEGDKTTFATQSFYGIKDENSAKKLTRADLVGQTITEVTYSGALYRTLSSLKVGSKKGWYIDLPGNGERVITEPVATGTYDSPKVIFTTFTPSTDPCLPGGISWLMQVNMDTGGEPKKPVFVVPGRPDGTVPVGDSFKRPSGLHLSPGTMAPFVIVSDTVYVQDVAKEIKSPSALGGNHAFGLRSWRHLLPI
ncbi:MAG: pilus assembly protein PilY [Desulfuromonadales bacterium]|nr:MAG: pilus assembly protein PilY [Desulfuromonadales bacterium]